jgi:hypothetical protein
VAPLRLRGLRGKQSTPSDWLGGTGEVSTVASRSGEERGTSFEADVRQWYGPLFGSVECILFTSAIITIIVLKRNVNGIASPFDVHFYLANYSSCLGY